jgi:primary-amine oxidase
VTAAAAAAETAAMSSSAHPLDPLSAAEISQVRELLARERGVGAGWRWASIELREPSKDVARDHRPGDAIERAATAVVWDRADGAAYVAVVSVTSDSVKLWTHVEGQHPNLTVDEWHECDAFLHHEPRLAEALAARGVSDLSLVLVDVWAYGAALVPERYRGMRIGWGDVWLRSTPDGNPYANPIGNLHPIVDLNRMELLEIEDGGPVEPVGSPAPPIQGEYLPALVGTPPREIKPLDIVQPDGVSFSLDGNLLRWQNWELRIGFNYREALVLHTIGYRDQGRLRSVAHRLSFAEMVVPYRDPSPDHYRRTAFDIGEWGLGFMTTSLTLGCDCLGEITYLDAVLHDSHGEPVTIPNAICIHEEDNAVLWKHVDPAVSTEVRRMRRLVLSFHATVANYEYLVYWRLYQDGNIECEVRATGIMVTSRFAPGETPVNGTIVDHSTYAPFHQHFIVARLDLDVDDPDNTVYETHTEPAPIGPENPHGLALVAKNTALLTEQEGVQDPDWATQRSWKVVNPKSRNAFGMPVGYKLVPSASIPAMFDPAAPVLRRAAAIAHTLWVTPFHADERWPCGDFPNLSETDPGLPVWTAADRPIADTDVVLWYVFGIHHVTRTEDWPVMPADVVSFWLKPFGFFDRNPALDVPPTPGQHSGGSEGCHS